MINYYDVLEVSPTASKEQIKEAYKKISVKVHPDKYGGDEYYTEIFQVVNEARVVLTDEAKRAEYDEQLKRSFRSNFNNTPRTFNSLSKKWIVLLSATAGFLVFVILLPSSDLKELQQQRVYTDGYSSVPLKNDANKNQRQIKMKSLSAAADIAGAGEEKANKTSPNTGSLTTALVRPGQQLSEGNKALQNRTFIKNRIKPVEAIKLSTIGLAKALPAELPITEPTELAEQKRLDEAQMRDILVQVNALKANSPTNVNCVKILRTRNSNVGNAFDLAVFLKSNGYIISGRETVKSNLEGVDIKENDQCIYVTVGNY